MNRLRATEHPDDEVLIDFLNGNCSADLAGQVRERLEKDPDFARRSQKIATVFQALDAYEAPEPSEELIARTLAAVESAGRTRALLDREAAQTRTLSFPSFSLRELGAVAAMLVVVGAILVPSWRHAAQMSRQTACVARVGEIGAALGHYANENNGQLPALGLEDAAWFAYAQAPLRVSNSQNLWQLITGQYIKDPVLFQCPSGEVQPFSVAASLIDFPGPQYIGYSYQNGVNSPPVRLDAVDDPASMAILADQTPLANGQALLGCQSQQNSPNHGGRGQSVLYLDMHAAWQTSPNVGHKGDNIWVAQGIDEYQGIERPAAPTDSFLLPNFVQPRPTDDN